MYSVNTYATFTEASSAWHLVSAGGLECCTVQHSFREETKSLQTPTPCVFVYIKWLAYSWTFFLNERDWKQTTLLNQRVGTKKH